MLLIFLGLKWSPCFRHSSCCGREKSVTTCDITDGMTNIYWSPLSPVADVLPPRFHCWYYDGGAAWWLPLSEGLVLLVSWCIIWLYAFLRSYPCSPFMVGVFLLIMMASRTRLYSDSGYCPRSYGPICFMTNVHSMFSDSWFKMVPFLCASFVLLSGLGVALFVQWN